MSEIIIDRSEPIWLVHKMTDNPLLPIGPTTDLTKLSPESLNALSKQIRDVLNSFDGTEADANRILDAVEEILG